MNANSEANYSEPPSENEELQRAIAESMQGNQPNELEETEEQIMQRIIEESKQAF